MIKENNFGTLMKIIDVLPNNKVLIQFQDKQKYEKEIHWNNFKSGNVKNPYDKTIENVGYFGVGKYSTRHGKQQDIYYTIWRHMIIRCYSQKERGLHPAYEDCYVCDEWHNYQNFADWCEENYYDIGDGKRMHIDKDILVKNNRIYSPKTCLFVPQRINMIFMTKSKERDSDLPNAIYRYNSGYQSFYNGTSLGIFNTVEEAVNEHNKVMRIHIKQVANEYKKLLPPHVYDALMRW